MSSPWAALLRSRLALDLRSLALFRAGLGAILLIDALCRLGSAALLYSDVGVLPRAAAVALIEPARLSLHMANGSALFALALTALQALAAAALLFGWRARGAVLLCWVLAVSAAARNPLVVTAGDALAIALLGWGLFLPLHARWSVDAATRREDNPSPEYFSWPGVVVLAQALCLFLFAALAQPGTVGLPSQPLLPALTAALDTALWWDLLLIAPLALLSLIGERYGLVARRLALGLMLLLCLLAILCDDSGTLPWLGLFAALLWVDAGLWERLGRTDAPGELRLFYAADEPSARTTALLLREMLCLPRTQVAAAEHSPRAARLMQPGKQWVLFDRDDTAHLDGAALHQLLQHSPLLRPLRALLAASAVLALCERLLPALRRCQCGARDGARPQTPTFHAGPATQILLLTLGLWMAMAQLGAPSAWTSAVRAVLMPLGLDYDWTWRVTADSAAWIALPGELRDGRAVDARSEALPAPQFVREQAALIPGLRGVLYERRLLEAGTDPARLALAQYLCTRRGDTLSRLRVVMMLPTADASAAPAEQRVLLRHDCR